MSAWSDFYTPKMNPESVKKFRAKYWEFIAELMLAGVNLKRPGTFAEFGCGTGIVTKFLYSMLPDGKHLLIDNCPEMIALAESNLPPLNYPNVVFSRNDIRELGLAECRYDVIHSHGVLEHFSDEDIVKIVKNMRDRSSRVFAYVPSNKYEDDDHGGKIPTRLLSGTEWAKLTGCQVTEFNEGFDLILTWRQ